MTVQLRPLFVLRQIQIPWTELQPGDIFRTGQFNAADMGANESAWNLALTGAESDEGPNGPPAVIIAPITIDADDLVGYRPDIPVMRINTERMPWTPPEPTLFGALVDGGVATVEKYAFPQGERAGATTEEANNG